MALPCRGALLARPARHDIRLLRSGSAWRPRHRAPAEDVRMDVPYRLACIGASVEDDTVTALGDPFRDGDLMGVLGHGG